jgi:hypothetical protein
MGKIITPGGSEGIVTPDNIEVDPMQALMELCIAVPRLGEAQNEARNAINRIDMTLYTVVRALQDKGIMTQNDMEKYSTEFNDMIREQMSKRGFNVSEGDSDGSGEAADGREDGGTEEAPGVIGNPWSDNEKPIE